MNQQIATGHIMRCLSVADALRGINEDVTFILADEQAVMLLKERGYGSIVLNTKWDDMESELSVISSIINKKQIKKLLIDSYQVTEKYLTQLNKMVTTIYIDDLDKFDYPVHAVICYANYWKKFSYDLSNPDKKYYLGLEYVPLKKAFWDCDKKVIHKRASNLLVLTGGSDPYNISGKLLDGIDINKFENIDVICGMYNKFYDDLVQRFGNDTNIRFHRAVNNIEDYMKKADIAISAGGTTLYELCACGTPAISYSFVDNQLDNVRQFAEDGLIEYAGDIREIDIVKPIKEIIDNYLIDPKMRENKSVAMQKVIDGSGAKRIANVLYTINI